MSSKTKIIVLHMKEIIYTVIFAVLAIVFILLILFMFLPSKKEAHATTYIPGIYTSSFSLNNTDFEVEVTVDESHINAIRFCNLDESVTTMYPLIQPAMENIADQICAQQSTDNITLSKEMPYTSQVILNAVCDALTKAGEH